MQVLINVTGHGSIPDASYPELAAAVARIVEVAATAGFPLRADCLGTQPDTPPEPVTVTAIAPATAVVGGADLVLHVHGTGFTPTSVILFNQGAEVTTYVSTTELTTGVKPSLVSAAIEVPVSVVGASSSVTFTFTAAGTQAARAPGRGGVAGPQQAGNTP